jgi:hypothetical protein
VTININRQSRTVNPAWYPPASIEPATGRAISSSRPTSGVRLAADFASKRRPQRPQSEPSVVLGAAQPILDALELAGLGNFVEALLATVHITEGEAGGGRR